MVDNLFTLSVAFRTLNWEPILHLPTHYYPTFVREFFANIIGRSHQNTPIHSVVKGVPVVIT